MNGSNLSFRYDGLGRRVSRTDDGLRSDYWYDTSGLTLETDTSGNRTNLLRDPGGNLRTIERITPTQQSSPVYNYGVDRLGSTTALTSTSGSLTNTYRYDPWGQPNGGTGTAYNPFRYTGTYLDTMTGLYQMGARYYQPGSGHFTPLKPEQRSNQVSGHTLLGSVGEHPTVVSRGRSTELGGDFGPDLGRDRR